MTTIDDAELVRRRGAKLSLLLAESDAPVPAMAFPEARIARAVARRSVIRWRAAAAIALLVAGAAGVPPVRAWIVSRVTSAWRTVSGASVPAGAPVPAAPAVTMGAVSFPATEQLMVRVLSRQESGALVIERGTGTSVHAAVTGERNGAEVVVGPEGLRLVNRRASTAGYVIRVPATVSRILVRVGNESARIFAGPDVGERFVVELAVRTRESNTLKQ
jgi:hypothetical protein